MGFIGEIFNTFLINPLTNLFVLLTTLTGNAGIAVILLTILIRIMTLPLTLKQMHSTRMMMVLGPRMEEIKKRYKDPRRRSEEQMRLYREAGVNPLGCFSSMILQFPILIALYQTFSTAMAEAPEGLIRVSNRLYDWDYLRSGFPLPADFLWMHLGRPDPLILPISVAATTYILQKMTMLPPTDERMRSQNQMMTMLMPLLFGWITISLPSGLGLYYALSNIIGMVMQYAYVGGGRFNWQALIGLSQEPVLPRALEVRQQQMETAQRAGRDPGDDGAASSNGRSGRNGNAAETDGARRRNVRQGNAARRRRRRSSP
jgi:YidC/Oxa1 family membrane protein insertase